MLHISNHLGSEHQKHNEISTHTCQNGYYQKTTNNKCWQGCGEKGTLMHCWWDCKFVKSLWKTVWKFLRKLNRITILSSSYISECYLKEKNTNLKRYVHYNTISNSQNKGVTQKSIQRWMDKYIYILSWVQSLAQEDPLEKGTAIHSSILAWRLPLTEELGGLWSIGSQRVRHDSNDLAHVHM